MSNPRLPTFKLRQIIQFESSELSAREVARALNLSHGAISKYRCAVRTAGVNWEQAQHLDDAELEQRIWRARTERKPRQVVLPDCATIHTELKRHQHVTLAVTINSPITVHLTGADAKAQLQDLEVVLKRNNERLARTLSSNTR